MTCDSKINLLSCVQNVNYIDVFYTVDDDL